MKFEVGANSRLQNIVWKYGFAAWTSPYGTKMAVKRMSSFAPCWAQRRNTTKEIFIERNSPLAEFILVICGWVSYRIRQIYFTIWTSLIDLCRGFAQLSVHWETRQEHSKKSWYIEIALFRREKQRCFWLQTIFLTNVEVNAKKLLLTF